MHAMVLENRLTVGRELVALVSAQRKYFGIRLRRIEVHVPPVPRLAAWSKAVFPNILLTWINNYGTHFGLEAVPSPNPKVCAVRAFGAPLSCCGGKFL